MVTASQQPTSGESVPAGSGFPTDDTNRQADSSSTGHDKAVNRLGEHLEDESVRIDRDLGTVGSSKIATAALHWLRAALAAGDPNVAEALGLKLDRRMLDDGMASQITGAEGFVRVKVKPNTMQRRFVTDWTEAP